MDWSNVAPMIVSVTLIVTIGAVILLRPLSKKLGDFLEAVTLEKQKAGGSRDEGLLRQEMARLETRLSVVEERLNFAESLLTGRGPADAGELPAGGSPESVAPAAVGRATEG
ncbi:MAG: hypothetical protein HY703_06130 [Gemmatimonadetes bacterium]|nr:hypothetical protein [Gemmatimonadota bacterium]